MSVNAIFDNHYISNKCFCKNAKPIALLADVYALYWSQTKNYISGIPCNRDYSIRVKLANGKMITFREVLSPISSNVSDAIAGLFSQDAKQRNVAKLHERERIDSDRFACFLDGVISSIAPRQLHDLHVAIRSNSPYSFCCFNGQGTLLRHSRILQSRIVFDIADIVDLSPRSSSYKLRVIINNQYKDIDVGTPDSTPNFHLLQLVATNKALRNNLVAVDD